MSTRDQCTDLIEGEFSKKWESLSQEVQIFLARLLNENFEKQTSLIKKFNAGTSKTTPKKFYSQKSETQQSFKKDMLRTDHQHQKKNQSSFHQQKTFLQSTRPN